MSDDVTWLTQVGYDALVEEYERRQGPERKSITSRIEKAREEGDLRENSGYHAAREDQGKNEARILQLRALLAKAKVGSPDAHPDEVAHGKVVTIRFTAFDEVQTFLLGSREEAPHASIEVFSPSSPLGEAITGKRIGESATYTMPNGKDMTVEITDVQPYQG